MSWNKNDLYFLLILITGLALAASNHQGIAPSDEYLYSLNAWKLAFGGFELSPSAFDNRFGWLIPQSLSVRLFGGGPYALIIPSLFAYLILLLTFWFGLYRLNRELAFVSLLLLAFNPGILDLAGDVSPDLLMTAWATLAIFICYFRKGKWQIWKGFVCALTLFLAFTTKMSVIYIVPFFLFLLLFENRKYPTPRFWISMLITGGLLLGLYLFAYYQYTGDALFRWRGVEAEHNLSEWAYYGKTAKEILLRMTISPGLFLLGSGIAGFLLLIFIPALPFIKKYKDPILYYFGTYTLFLLVIHWLGTTSLNSYNPLPIYDRMWLLLVPPLSILCARALLYHYPIRWKKHRFPFTLLILVLIAAILGFFFLSDRFHYFWLSALVGIYLVFFPGNTKLGIGILVFILLLPQFQRVFNYHDAPFFREKAFLENLDPDKQTLILTDSVFTSKPWAHLEFERSENFELRNWHEWDEEVAADWDAIYIIYNAEREAIMREYFKRPAPETGILDQIAKEPRDLEIVRIK